MRDVMDSLRAWGKRLRALITPGRADREMTEEMAFHLEMEVEQNVRAGMSPAEARRAARVKFGGVERFKEEVRSTRGLPWVESFLSDLGHAGRGLRRAPGFAAAAVATLGLGIGAATSMFSVVDAVVLAPLPYQAPDELVYVWETNPDGADFSTSEPNYLDFRDRGRSVSSLGAYRTGGGSLTLATDAGPRLVSAASATHSLFTVLGVKALHGRLFSAAEDQPGGRARVVVLGHEFWHSAFGGDPAVVGTTLPFDGGGSLVIGVLPADFRLLGVDLWTPLAPDPSSDRADRWLGMIGRLRPGATRAQAQADLAAIATQNGSTYPALAGWGVRVVGLEEWIVGPKHRLSSLVLMAGVGVLLLLACANVATLLLARATARQADISLRLALGAGQGRLIRQLVTESGLTALLGAVVGLAGAWWVVEVLRGVPPGLVPRLETVAINGRVVLFALGATVFATVGSGVLPAVQAARSDVHSTLKQAGRGAAPRGQQRLREWLVVGQVGLAMVLVVVGGLMIRSLLRLQQVDTGLLTERVWTVPVQVSTSKYPEEAQVARFFDATVERIKAIPGVRSAAVTIVDPYRGFNLMNDVTPEERAAEHPNGGFVSAAWRIVSPGYFEAAGVPLLRGRDYGLDDRPDGPPVAIVSRSLAERLWPGHDPVGRRLFWGGTDGTLRTVIGVAGDIRDVNVQAEPQPMLFLSTRQMSWPAMTYVVRADREMPAIGPAVRQAIWAEDPTLPVPTVRPLAESRSAAIAGPRFNTLLLGGFAAASLVLALIGLYGVLAFAVVERTREIGVRIALGAGPGRVVSMVVGRGLTLTIAGVVGGMLVAALVTRLLAALLYDTPGLDPVTFLVAPALFGVVGLAAGYLPARRAARVDPLTALRGE